MEEEQNIAIKSDKCSRVTASGPPLAPIIGMSWGLVIFSGQEMHGLDCPLTAPVIGNAYQNHIQR